MLTASVKKTGELDSNTCALGGSQILTYPKEVNGTVIPAVTNTTACKDGFSAGYKNWCINHAVDCVENMTLGHFPDMVLKAHDQYNMGYKAAIGSGNLYPIGENAAFCPGWNNNNGEDHECGDAYDNYSGPFSNGLI